MEEKEGETHSFFRFSVFRVKFKFICERAPARPLGAMSQAAKVSNFVGLTGADAGLAKQYLQVRPHFTPHPSFLGALRRLSPLTRAKEHHSDIPTTPSLLCQLTVLFIICSLPIGMNRLL